MKTRTWLVAIALIIICAALVMRYYVVGVIYSGLLIAIVKSALKKKIAACVALTAIALLIWGGVQAFGPYTSFRNTIVWGVGVDRLQSWALETLDSPPRLGVDGPEDSISPDDVPPDIWRIAKHGYVILRNSPEDGEPYIMIHQGGGFYHWGVLVGSNSFRPSKNSDYRYDRLADGVWSYQER